MTDLLRQVLGEAINLKGMLLCMTKPFATHRKEGYFETDPSVRPAYRKVGQ